ncbi:MAG TPA: FG-GAP-like repeat-containing protein [Phycisphaerae bacterium]|nr:FG-GAP-like repeat-containing protein [Phycisphaerae bacterium]HRW54206.1 FG-GAP-like repeat-containing protein [Phycisphaerae bacterium]
MRFYLRTCLGMAVVVSSSVGTAAASTPSFSDQTLATGITAVHIPVNSNYLYISGGCVADFNNDGWQDIYFCGGGGAADCLYVNNADGTFTDRAADWGIQTVHLGAMGAAGDFDGDGWIDLFVVSLGAPEQPGNGRNRLYRNMNGQAFHDATASSGINPSDPSPTSVADSGFSAAWGDYDLDGDLDLVIARRGNGPCLMQNDGNGAFVDVSNPSFITIGDTLLGFSPRFADMDGDRHPELLFVADYNKGHYWVNSGHATFIDLTTWSGTMVSNHDMGMTIADFNRDGLFDFYVTSINQNALHINQGDHVYSNDAEAAGVKSTGWGWGTVSPDIDHDGWPDLITTGKQGQYAFLNRTASTNTPQFVDVSLTLGIRGDSVDNGRGLANFDYDNDGDEDVLVYQYNGALKLYRNDLAGDGDTHWLRVFLDSSGSPYIAPNGIGSVVKITANGSTQMGRIDGGSNYLSQSEMSAHFGLGAASVVDELRIEWLNGAVTIMHDVPADQTITIPVTGAMLRGDLNCDGTVDLNDVQPFSTALADAAAYANLYPSCDILAADLDQNGEVNSDDIPAFVELMDALVQPPTLSFSDQTMSAGVSAVHTPGGIDGASIVAGGCVADFNNDGWQDFYFCAGGGAADSLYINNGDGTFTDRAAEWGIDIVHAGSTGVAADFDGDGRIDLFVSSLGDADDLRQGQNRLYRNSPDNTFVDVTAVSGINVTPSTPVTYLRPGFGGAVGDYDLDGDLDLAVSQAGQHHLLLRNDGDMRFSDVSIEAGIVDDGVAWSTTPRFVDLNGDRFPEIVWNADTTDGRYFVNNTDGTFTDGTGTSAMLLGGMGCASADFDRDGRFDVIATRGGFSALYVNQGNHVFLNAGDSAGARFSTSVRATICPDINLDGWPDLVATNQRGLAAMLNRSGDVPTLSFQELSRFLGLQSDEFDPRQGLANLDYDNDGDQDLVVFKVQGPVKLLRNDLVGHGDTHWLRVFLDTSAAGDIAPNGIGSVVKVTTGGFTQMGRIDGGSNYLSQSEMSAHFGLGTATVVDELRVEWTNGDVTVMNNVAADQTITIAASGASLLGDMNCDAVVDLADIAPFALALTDAAGYAGAYPACDINAADMDASGAIDGRDVAAFVVELLN